MQNNLSTVQVLIDNSDVAMISWNNIGFEERIAILQRWAQQQPKNIAAMITFQCANALEYVAKRESMPGPTGESNELYCCGRGVFIITVQKKVTVQKKITAQENVIQEAIVGQLVAALVCGNSVLLCIENEQYAVQIKDQLEQLGCIAGVITVVSIGTLDALVNHPQTVGIAYCGDADGAQQLARQLAQREGILAQLVVEIDMTALPVIGSQTYCLRFVTERTCTINITAVGGNAILLELGSGDVAVK